MMLFKIMVLMKTMMLDIIMIMMTLVMTIMMIMMMMVTLLMTKYGLVVGHSLVGYSYICIKLATCCTAQTCSNLLKLACKLLKLASTASLQASTAVLSLRCFTQLQI